MSHAPHYYQDIYHVDSLYNPSEWVLSMIFGMKLHFIGLEVIVHQSTAFLGRIDLLNHHGLQGNRLTHNVAEITETSYMRQKSSFLKNTVVVV